jgi:hypothetical protein
MPASWDKINTWLLIFPHKQKPAFRRVVVRTLHLLICSGNYYLVPNFSRIRADLPERSRK